MIKNERFKEVITDIKYKYKITQKEIAARIGIKSNSYLSDIINGKYDVTESISNK